MSNRTQDQLFEAFQEITVRRNQAPEEEAATVAPSLLDRGQTGDTGPAPQARMAAAVSEAFGPGSSEPTEDTAMEAANPVGGGQTGDTAPAAQAGVAAAVSEAIGPGSVWATPAGSNVRGGASTEQSGGGAGSTAESVAIKFFESGFGIVPLISGLAGLFGGGSSSLPPLEKYEMPSTISFASADTRDGLMAMNLDQRGMPRVLDGGGSGLAWPGTGPASPAVPASPPAAGAPAPQITVNVQAMDAQSFLDHSSQIAEAVRSAMLSMNSINDVVNEL